MSSVEFSECMLVLQREEDGARHTRLRHAQLLAALHNGAMLREDKRAWKTTDFLAPDPWEPPAPPPAEMSLEAGVALFNAGMG